MAAGTTVRPYHHGDLRGALVAAALERTRTGGPAGLSLREVTRDVGVSPAAAYRHFADRGQLLAAVAHEIQQRMAARMRTRMRAPRDADRHTRALLRLRGVGLGYVAFAVAEPGWFETAFFDTLSTSRTVGADGRPVGGAAEAVPPPFALLTAALDDLVAAGGLAPARRLDAELSCWSAVHGCAELIVHGPLRGADPGTVRRVTERVVDDIVVGVTAAPPTTHRSGPDVGDGP